MFIWCWHAYHNTPVSLIESIAGRIRDIKANNPEEEHALRLRLLKSVKGKLPAAVLKAGAAYKKAETAYEKVVTACDKAWTADNKKAWAAYYKAIADNLPAIKKLHAKECKNCPYDRDRKTIFSDKE